MIPQIIFLTLVIANRWIDTYEYGRGKQSLRQYIIGYVSAIILLAILTWGGFFNVFIK